MKTTKLENCKHPNSRKTKALVKQIKKENLRDKSKFYKNVKLCILKEKIEWFKANLGEECGTCTPKETSQLISKYLERFNDELEQIKLKHSIGNRKNRQHANRESIIQMTIKRETEEFNTCGIEIPDILNSNQMKLLREWNGELAHIQKFKLKRYSKQMLNNLDKNVVKDSSHKAESKMNME